MRRRGLEQEYWSIVEREERRRYRIADYSDKSIADWGNQSRMEKAARNKESRLEYVEWRPAEMGTDGGNCRRDGRRDEYGGGSDAETT